VNNSFSGGITTRPWYKHYVLLLLVLVYAINIMDRQVLALLLEDIKREFALTDSELGLLGGLAFAFFYSVMGIPLARWSDRGNRKTMLAVCLLCWSMATVLCGFAIGFLSLIAARIGTAIGEAGGSPTSHAMIADYFSEKERATALAVFALGVPLGSIAGNLASGWLNEFFAWRAVFIAVGVPGIFVALLVYCSLHEPARVGQLTVQHIRSEAQSPGLTDALWYLWSQKSYVHMCLAAGLHSVVWYAGSTWNASFLMRSHGIGAGAAGSWIATFALVGLLGTFLGGFLADRLAVKYRDQRWYLWLPGIAIILSLPFQLFSYLSESLATSITSFWVMTIFAATFFGPSYAVSQTLARPQIRALASSMLIFVQTLIGLGVGPSLVGAISDYLAPTMGANSLRYGLAAVGSVNALAAYHYFRGSKTYREDIEAVRQAPPTSRHLPELIHAAEGRRDRGQFI
jgi:predicted MFS family arabinose efflux permease